jgi:glycosyltransferase involved in cell wall biosynthesis
LLAEGLVARGHDVTLFATADSVTAARLRSVAPTGYEEDLSLDAKVHEGLHIANAFERAGEFDVLSNQFDFLPLTFSRLVATPMVTTIHGFSSPKIVPVYRAYDDIARFVAISDSDRHPDLGYETTIHHGIDLAQFTFAPELGKYLLFLGRIHPDKGTHLAIEAARRAGIPLIIAGIIQDHEYFTSVVEPELGPETSYVGPVEPAQRDALLGGALGLLHLISFAEPFGLSVVESLAAGTPVVAFRLGSMPEIIRHGATGFLVDDLDQAVDAIVKLERVDRRDCRADVEKRFTTERMVADYSAVFVRAAAGEPPVSRSSNSGSLTKAKRTEESLAPKGSSS